MDKRKYDSWLHEAEQKTIAAQTHEANKFLFFGPLHKRDKTEEEIIEGRLKYAHVQEGDETYIGLADNQTLEVYATVKPYPQLEKPLRKLPGAKFIKLVISTMEL